MSGCQLGFTKKEIERKKEDKIRKYDFTEEENGTDDDIENFEETADGLKKGKYSPKKGKTVLPVLHT